MLASEAVSKVFILDYYMQGRTLVPIIISWPEGGFYILVMPKIRVSLKKDQTHGSWWQVMDMTGIPYVSSLL